MNKFTYLAFITIFLISIATNFINIEQRYSVGWDQTRDAEIVYEQIVQQKDIVLLGPRVVGPSGFFLGPMHYYLLIPFYAFFNGDMIAAAYLSATIGVLTTLALMYISYKIFNLKAALTSGLISALLPQVVSWNVMYLPLLTITIFWLCRKLLEKKYNMIIWAGGLVGIGLHIHFTVVILLILVILAVILSKPEKREYKKIFHFTFLAFGIIILTLLPLLVFDLAHSFMNLHLFFNFFFNNSSSGFKLNFLESLRVFLNAFDIFNLFKSTFYSALFSLLFFSIALISAYYFDRKKFLFTSIWLFLPLILFSFYNGNITEYYFLTTGYIAIFYLGLLSSHLDKRYSLVFCVAIIFAFLQAKSIIQTKDPFALINQKKVVHFLVTQQKDSKFNLSYEIFAGQNAAFPYLFRRVQKQPTNTNYSHLYTVINMPTEEKYNELEVFGGFGLVRR